MKTCERNCYVLVQMGFWGGGGGGGGKGVTRQMFGNLFQWVFIV
jgi:hypothetical protein